jgi:hypothetical protein
VGRGTGLRGRAGETGPTRAGERDGGLWGRVRRFVREFGIRLLPELYEKLNPMSYAEAAKKEEALARALRRRGLGVWQH